MLTLSKPCTPVSRRVVAAAVEGVLEPVAWDVDRLGEMSTYKIWPKRYSMFVVFSEVQFWSDENQCSLRLRLSRLSLGVFFGFPLIFLIVCRLLGPLALGDAALAVLLFAAVYGLALLDCQGRVSRWWDMI
jgi:hypothetical protein